MGTRSAGLLATRRRRWTQRTDQGTSLKNRYWKKHNTKQEAIEKLPEFLIFNSTADQPENLSIRQRIAELAYSLPEDELRSILQKHEKKFLTFRG